MGRALQSLCANASTFVNKTTRIITHSSWNACDDQLFKGTKITEIQKVHVYKVALERFRVEQKICPTLLSNLFHENKNVHNYYTRQ